MLWVDDDADSAWFVLSDSKGRGTVEKHRAETAAWVARYQGDYEGEPGNTTPKNKLLPLPAGCFVLCVSG